MSKQLLGLTLLTSYSDEGKRTGQTDRQAGRREFVGGGEGHLWQESLFGRYWFSQLSANSVSEFPPSLIISIKNTELLGMWTCCDT